MLLIIQSYVMPAISRRECGCFCSLLITILIAKIPVSRFHRKYSNTGFVEYFCVITTPGAFRIVFIQTWICGGGNSMAAGNCQRRSRVNFLTASGVFTPLLKYNLSPTIKLSRLITSSVFFFSVSLIRLSKFSAPNFPSSSPLVATNRIPYSVGVIFQAPRPCSSMTPNLRRIIHSL